MLRKLVRQNGNFNPGREGLRTITDSMPMFQDCFSHVAWTRPSLSGAGAKKFSEDLETGARMQVSDELITKPEESQGKEKDKDSDSDSDY